MHLRYCLDLCLCWTPFFNTFSEVVKVWTGFYFAGIVFEKITSFSDPGYENKITWLHDYSGSDCLQPVVERHSYIQTGNYRACLYDKQSQQKNGSGQNNY